MGASDSSRSSDRKNAGLKKYNLRNPSNKSFKSHQCTACHNCTTYVNNNNQKQKRKRSNHDKFCEMPEKRTRTLNIHKESRCAEKSQTKLNDKRIKEKCSTYQMNLIEKSLELDRNGIDQPVGSVPLQDISVKNSIEACTKKENKVQKKDKFCERPEKIKIPVTLEIHKDKKSVENSKTKLKGKHLKEKCSTNKINVCGKSLLLDGKIFENSLTNGGIDQPVGSIPLGNLKNKNLIQACTKKEKTKVQKKDPFCRGLEKIAVNYTLKRHKNRRCVDKLKTEGKIKNNISQNSIRCIKDRCQTNKKNRDKTDRSSESTCLMNSGEFPPNFLLANLEESTNSNSSLPKRRSTELSLTEDLLNIFLDASFWQKLRMTMNPNEFITKVKTTNQFVSELVEKAVKSTDAFEMESRNEMDITSRHINNIDEVPIVEKDAKSNELLFKIPSVVIPAELTSALDGSCHERPDVTCEELNPKSDCGNAFNANEMDITSRHINNIDEVPIVEKDAKSNEQLFKIPSVVIPAELTSALDGSCHERPDVTCEELNPKSDCGNVFNANEMDITSRHINNIDEVPIVEKDAKSNEQLFKIPSVVIPAELTSALDGSCHERPDVTCEELNPKSDCGNAFNANEMDITSRHINNIDEVPIVEKDAKSNEQLFKIPSVVIPAELTSALDGSCHERPDVTCEELNPKSDCDNAFNANNSTSDIPILQNEELKDALPDLDHSYMPVLSLMSEKSFAVESTISQTCVDLHQNSYPRQTEAEWNSKHNQVISTDEKKQKSQTVPQAIGVSDNDKINLGELSGCLSDYDACIVVEKYKSGEIYKCGRCCKLFELKTANLHKNCDIIIRTVLIDNLNFLCINCYTLFETLDVLSSHKEKCLSANKSAINKSLQSDKKSDLISSDNISKRNDSSNFSCQRIEDKNYFPKDPQCSISSFICSQCNKQITGKHAQEHHRCKASVVESNKNSGVSDNLVSTQLSSNLHNSQTLKLGIGLEDSQSKLTHPVTVDSTSKSDTINSEMPLFIDNMSECGLLYSPNEGAKFSVPPSYKCTVDLLSYFQNLEIKKEQIESDPNQTPSIPENCTNCQKPLHFEMPMEETYSSVDSNNLLQLKLPCSACKHLFLVVFRKDILNLMQYFNEQKNLPKHALQEQQNNDRIRIKEEPDDENLFVAELKTILNESENHGILPHIAQVVTISSDEFFKDENSPANTTKNSLQQEHLDPVNQKTMPKVNLNKNSSVSNFVVPHCSSIPEQIENASFALSNVNPTMSGSIARPVIPHHASSIQNGNASVASHNKPSISAQGSEFPSEIILDIGLFPEPDLYITKSESEHETYICGECMCTLMKDHIAKHFVEEHNIRKNNFSVETIH